MKFVTKRFTLGLSFAIFLVSFLAVYRVSRNGITGEVSLLTDIDSNIHKKKMKQFKRTHSQGYGASLDETIKNWGVLKSWQLNITGKSNCSSEEGGRKSTKSRGKRLIPAPECLKFVPWDKHMESAETSEFAQMQSDFMFVEELIRSFAACLTDFETHSCSVLQKCPRGTNEVNYKGVGGTEGWPLCEGFWKPPKNCIAYDIGIRTQWGLPEKLHKLFGCMPYSFDPSDKYERSHRNFALKNKWANFHYWGLGSSEIGSSAKSFTHFKFGSVGNRVKTFKETMQKLNHDKVHVIKIDCEGCEWEMFHHIATQSPKTLSDTHVILVEMHFARHLQMNSVQALGYTASFFWHVILNHGFRVWYVGFNDGWDASRDMYPEIDSYGFNRLHACYEVAL